MNTILHHSSYVRYLLLATIVSSYLLVSCGTPSSLNPFIDRERLVKKLQEMNNYAARGDTITVRTLKGDRYTFSRFSIDNFEARGVLLATQFSSNGVSNYVMTDSVLTIPRKDIFSVKVHIRRSVTNQVLGGFAYGTLGGYLLTGVSDWGRRSENESGLTASAYHTVALTVGVATALAIWISPDDDHNYYYFCPNDDCEGIESNLDRIWGSSGLRW
jgi:hypothetical protein